MSNTPSGAGVENRRATGKGSPLNVLVLSHIFPPLSGAFVLEQIKALRGLGVSCHVLAPTPWTPPPLKSLLRFRRYAMVPATARLDGVAVEYPRVVCFPGTRFFCLYGFFYYLRCRWILRRLLKHNRIDLLHAHTIMPDGFAAVLLGREFNLPVVCTLHGSDINVYPNRGRLTRQATRWALRRIKNLIAVSSDLKKRTAALTAVCDVKVVPNGAHPEVFYRRAKEEARETLGLPAGERIVLFIGQLTAVKGIEYLLKAISHLRQSQVLLVLVGDGELKESLARRAEELGVAEACRFVGKRPHDEVPLWLSAADCLALPSLSEGLPTVLVEAMWCRTPIVATSVGGVPEIVKPGRTGLLVPPRDPLALAGAIAELLNNKDLGLAFTENAARLAQQKLTWAENGQETLLSYEAALAGSGFGASPAITSINTPHDRSV